MRERRGWVVASVLLLLGAAAGAGAVREHWLSCRGAMFSGSIVRGFAYGPDFSDACLRAMDDGFSFVWPDGKDPFRPEALYGTVAALVLAAAWLAVVATSAWSRRTRVVAVLPSVAGVVISVVSSRAGRSDALDSAFFWLLVLLDLLAVVAFVTIGVREAPGRRTMWQTAIALAASTAVGYFHSFVDYLVMVSFSDANWDTPPGTGYPTVVATTLLALALLLVTVTEPRARMASPDLEAAST